MRLSVCFKYISPSGYVTFPSSFSSPPCHHTHQTIHDLPAFPSSNLYYPPRGGADPSSVQSHLFHLLQQYSSYLQFTNTSSKRIITHTSSVLHPRKQVLIFSLLQTLLESTDTFVLLCHLLLNSLCSDFLF